MELGGKASVIVFDDANIDEFVAGIGTFGVYNAGQDGTAACRLYVPQLIYQQVVTKVGEAGDYTTY